MEAARGRDADAVGSPRRRPHDKSGMNARPGTGTGLALLAILLTVEPLSAQAVWNRGHPDAHGPIGVVGTPTLQQGELLLAYRLGYVLEDGNLIDSQPVTVEEILQVYDVTPVSRPLYRHEPALMLGLADVLLVRAALPIVSMRMDHVTDGGTAFSVESSGVEDLQLDAMLRLYDGTWMRAYLILGASLPTGSVDARGDIPPSPPDEDILPYPLQRGAGTPSIGPGLAFFGIGRRFSWGAQLRSRVHLDENSRNYRMGDRASGTAWVSRRWSGWVSTSVRLGARTWENVWGFDPDLLGRSMDLPSADHNLRAGQRVDLLFGANLRVPRGALEGHRLAVELGIPVHQSLEGPQLETDWIVSAGWTYELRLFGGEG